MAVTTEPQADTRQRPAPQPLAPPEITIPAKPDVLVRLSLLLADEAVDNQRVAQLINDDMALAAAVMKAVNAPLYGVAGRVQSVQQAVTYLGTRDVTAITFELGLRAAFPPAAELEPIWVRAAERGLWMGRLAMALGLDAWAAHSAGLFEECGKAVLFKHSPQDYAALLRECRAESPLGGVEDDARLRALELERFGLSHDALGAALCETWGLGGAAVASVRHHVLARQGPAWPDLPGSPALLALSVLVFALMHDPAALDALVPRLAPQAGLDALAVMGALRTLQAQRAELAGG